jgi:hypothetical protein
MGRLTFIGGGRRNMRWPRVLGTVPSLKDINLLCWLLLATIAAPLFIAHSGPEIRNADFVQLYSLGRILNEYPAKDLYNYQLQQKLSTEMHPLKDGFYGPSPYPPFVAVFLRPFAAMPYLSAYVLWMAISVLLYLAGIAILARRFFRGDLLRRSLIFCFALAYYPFIVGTVINGQLSAVGFFALSLAIYEDDRGRALLSGLALSLCAYKPTLLVLILPMLFITKRFKTLAGFGIGALALVLFATMLEGIRVWSGYFDVLFILGRIHPLLRLSRNIDLRAFTSLLSPTHSWVAVTAVLGCAAIAAFCLIGVWASSVRAGKPASALLWGTTLTWTLLLNIYVPVYDSILAILSMVVTARAMRNFSGRWFGILCALIFASAWITVEIAERTGVQVLTILLAALGALQLYACGWEIKISVQGRSLNASDKQPDAAAIAAAGLVLEVQN